MVGEYVVFGSIFGFVFVIINTLKNWCNISTLLAFPDVTWSMVDEIVSKVG